MGGKASIIYVVGFAVIAGLLNVNIARLSTRAVENMIGYGELTTSRNLANGGANVGLAMLNADTTLAENLGVSGRLLTTQTPAGSGGSFTVRMDSISSSHSRLRSVSSYSTIAGIMSDTVEVTFSNLKQKKFSTLGWMSCTENGVYFITGDTIFGKVHSNGTINIDGSPVFKEKVTTSASFNPAPSTKKKPTDNKAIYEGGYETGVAKKDFPKDFSDVRENRTNVDTTHELYVTFAPGTASKNNGKAYVRTGSFTGTITDTLFLSGTSDNLIYSSQNIHVQGTLDGRLSVISNKDVVIENDCMYETPPNAAGDNTQDMLGLIANNNVIVANNTANNGNDLYLHASVFARNGSFTAANYGTRGVEGTLRLIGSISQNIRGAVGNFSGSTLLNGYHKNYKYDNRLARADCFPPSFPNFYVYTLNIANWWESTRIPWTF